MREDEKLYIEAFVQSNLHHYIPEFYQDKTCKFNWSAFLFGAIWLFYRKMRIFGVVLLFILMILAGGLIYLLPYAGYSFVFLESPFYTLLLVNYFLNYFLARHANTLHVNFVRRQIKQLTGLYKSKKELLEVLKIRGGTDNFPYLW